MGSLLAKIAWQPALIHKGLWPLIGLHQKLTGDPLAASSFVTRLPVDPILVGDSGGKVTPPPSALMKVPAGVSYWLLKNSSKHPEWPSFLVGGPGKASGYFYLLRCFFEQKLSHSHGWPPSLCPPADRSGTDDLGHCLTIPGICEPRLEKSAPLTTLGASSIPLGVLCSV